MMSGLMFFIFISSVILMLLWNSTSLMYVFSLCLILSIIMVLPLFSFNYFLGELNFFVDGVSNNLVLLSLWLGLLMVYSSYKVFKFNYFFSMYSILMFCLVVLLVITFYVGDYLMFYLFFEATLIPTFLIIMGWGYQPERLQAGVYFMFYTLLASLPLLISIMYLFSLNLSLSFIIEINSGLSFCLVFMLITAFFVKLPMFFFHLWLPKAHVEAPVAGSMILAGVLLKLGGYGLLRVSPLIYKKMIIMNSYYLGLGVVSMMFVGLMCLRLNDFKALVAYSSVAHMSMVVCGGVSLYLWGWAGLLMMMISHGLSSSGLFCIVNMYYERFNSRSFYFNKGLISILPLFTLMLFVLSAANMAAPPSINLISEIFLMVSIMGFDWMLMLIFVVGSFLGAVFTIFMFSYSQHGQIYYLIYSSLNSSFRELHILIMHCMPIYGLILNSYLFISF